jgi:hypothetical protein
MVQEYLDVIGRKSVRERVKKPIDIKGPNIPALLAKALK